MKNFRKTHCGDSACKRCNEVFNPKPNVRPTYELCARCGFDHEHEPEQAQKAHKDCSLCSKEVALGMIGEGPDHCCQEERSLDIT